MRCLVTPSTRLARFRGGFYAHRAGLGRQFWERYVPVFDDVTVLASVMDVSAEPPEANRVDGEGVSVLPLANSLEAWRTLGEARRWLDANQGAFFVRAPNLLGQLSALRCRPGFPIAYEVVGDAFAVAETFGGGSAAKRAVAKSVALLMRSQVGRASSVAYVSRMALEPVFPPRRAAYVTEYSSIALDDRWFSPSSGARPDGTLRLITVASLDHAYKGVGDLIEAVALARTQVPGMHLTVLGGGRLLPEYQAQATARGLGDVVEFVGEVAEPEVIRRLDASDVFALASWTEGLPRSMIEAMARGLPVVGTRVGGAPGLVDPQFLVAPHAPADLAAALVRMLTNQSAWRVIGNRNAEVARAYSAEALRVTRDAFYSQHRDRTEAYWARRNASKFSRTIRES